MVHHAHLQLVMAILLVATTAVSTVSAAATFPPTSITSQYRQTKSVHFMNVDAGVSSSLTGSLAMQPALFGSHFPITSTVAGVPSFSAELVIPNSLDDPLVCRDDTIRTVDDFNQTFAGKVLLIRRGTCSLGVKGQKAEQAGAAGLVIFGCPTAAPTLCAPGLQQPTAAVVQVGIPVTFIQAADGEALLAYITARNAALKAGSGSIPAPLTMQVASTGALVSSELTALRAIAASTSMSQATLTVGWSHRPWNVANMNNASADPCLDRIAGIWCENGHIVEIYLAGLMWKSLLSDGSIPPELGQLTYLRYLSMQNNLFTGAVPSTFCQLTKLQELYLQAQVTGSYDGLTSLPSCLSALVAINTLQVNNNQINNFPDMNASPNLAYIDVSNNRIPSLPPSFSSWTNLNTFSGSNNKITTVLPSFSSLTKLTSFTMSGNLLTDMIQSTTFTNLTILTTLDLSNNQLSGVLPSFSGCTQLSTLLFSNNKLTGTVPSAAWHVNIPNLLLFQASHNQLISPVTGLNSLLLLQSVDLSWNNITSYTGNPTETDDAGALIASLTGPSVVTVNLGHNQLRGIFGKLWLALAKSLKTLDISYNSITSLPTDIFTIPALTSLDASNNQITSWGTTTTTPPASFIYLSIVNNPGLVATNLPSWMKADVQMVTNPGSVYQCPRIYNPTNVVMTIQVDAQFTKFQGCQCVPGRFGAPPLCYPVPQVSTLTQDGSFVAGEIGTSFGAVVSANSGRNEPNSSSSAVIAPDTITDRSFTDAWYGNQRLTLGMSTAFVVDLRSSSQPARFITFHIHINTILFDDTHDLLTIYQGPDSLTSPKVAAAQGNLPIPASSSTGVQEGYTKSAAYQALYGTKIAAMGSSIMLWEVVVLGPVATVEFNSRDTQGQHFFVTYSYSYTCEDLGVGYFYDDNQSQCRAPLEMYKVDSGIRAAVFALSSLAFVFVAVVAGLVTMHFDTAVIRASSRPFVLLTLLFLGMMSLGSLLYAAVPDESSLGKAVCHGRVWLAAFPLTGFLAILLAKTNRISNIFTMTKLMAVRHVQDEELLMVVGAMLAVTSIMLAVYSGVPLNSPRVAEGTSTYANKLVSSCHNADGFAPWIAILLIYIFVLMIAAAVLAFKARDVPSRYNESTHIMNALFLLIFFGALIVPLDIFIQDSPDASVLIQGIGQSLLVMTLTGVIFLPKMYVLFSKDVSSNENNNTVLAPVHTSISTLPKVSPTHSSGKSIPTAVTPEVDGNGRRKVSHEISTVTRKPSILPAATTATTLTLKTPTHRISLSATPQPQSHLNQQQPPQLADMSNMTPDMLREHQSNLLAALRECDMSLARMTREGSPTAAASSGSFQMPSPKESVDGTHNQQRESDSSNGSVDAATGNDDALASVVPITPNDIVLQDHE